MPSRPSVVGREREIETLHRLLDQARTGPGSMALIEGEPGIGKTRLIRETLGRAEALDFAVFLGAGEELARDRPFGPVAAALGLVSGAADPGRATIARLLSPDHDATGAWDRGPTLRYQVLDSILDLVEELSASGPVALALDDLQWADASTLLVMRHLGSRVASLPIVLLLASRPVERTGQLAGVIDALRPEGLVEVGLAPLSRDETADLAARLMQRTPSSVFLAQLAGAAGNPLLVTEFVAAAQDARVQLGD